MKNRCDAIILGGGAAGLMCAIEAGKRGRHVLLLERSDQIGKKILISGGGRCNFTNIHTVPENFVSGNPHFAKSALARYTPGDFIGLVEKHRIPYHEKKLGQLFCDGSASEIVAMLREECLVAGVTILTSAAIQSVTKNGNFEVHTPAGTHEAAKLVIATGGLSIPKIGATSFGYDLARQFGIKMRTPRPALVPFLFRDLDRKNWCDLAGVSVEVIASTAGYKQGFREKMLFTHRGLSGPAILQVSTYWDANRTVEIDLAPERDLASEMRKRGHRDPAAWKSLLRELLPRRLADRWLEFHAPDGMSDGALAAAEHQLHHWSIVPQETEGYAKAEVTAGGVDTDELSAKTMESRRIPGLYFIGEVVDVTGHLGGFNFQWAWASGYCAGQAL